MNFKEWLQFIGLGGLLSVGGLLGLLFIALFSIVVTAGPVILVVWVVWKLFFN